MSFNGLKPVRCYINIGPGSSFTANIVGVSLETHHSQVRDGVQGCGHLKEFNFLDVAVNRHLKRRWGLGGMGLGTVHTYRRLKVIALPLKQCSVLPEKCCPAVVQHGPEAAFQEEETQNKTNTKMYVAGKKTWIYKNEQKSWVIIHFFTFCFHGGIFFPLYSLITINISSGFLKVIQNYCYYF